jgi:hypothetical protein
MPAAPLCSDDFLDPVPADQPAGTDLRWTAEWDRIKEARRADDALESGKWEKMTKASTLLGEMVWLKPRECQTDAGGAVSTWVN